MKVCTANGRVTTTTSPSPFLIMLLSTNSLAATESGGSTKLKNTTISRPTIIETNATMTLIIQ
jgi:hypothetical protein